MIPTKIVPNVWIEVTNEGAKDREFLKYSLKGEGYEVQYVLYTPVQSKIYFSLVQAVTYQVPADVINYAEKDAEEVINDLVLDGLTEMHEHGVIMRPKTSDIAKVILESLNISDFVFTL